MRPVGYAQVVLCFEGFAAWDAACVSLFDLLDGAVLAADAACMCEGGAT